MITVKELIEKLKEFPEDREVLDSEYFSVEVYEDSSVDGNTKYVIIA